MQSMATPSSAVTPHLVLPPQYPSGRDGAAIDGEDKTRHCSLAGQSTDREHHKRKKKIEQSDCETEKLNTKGNRRTGELARFSRRKVGNLLDR